MLSRNLRQILSDFGLHAERELEEMRTRHRASIRKLWEEWAKQHLPKLLESCNAASDYLEHPDAAVRKAALSVLFHHWKPDDRSVEVAEKMLVEDVDDGVREFALAVWCDSFYGKGEPRVGQLLARIVRNESAPLSLRCTAYAHLCGLLWTRHPAPLETARLLRERRFPEDVDWTFVDTFLV